MHKIERAVYLVMDICEKYELKYHFPLTTCHFLLELYEYYGEFKYHQIFNLIFGSKKWVHPTHGFSAICKSRITSVLHLRRTITVDMLRRGIYLYENIIGNLNVHTI
jgi:hypothetical protein